MTAGSTGDKCCLLILIEVAQGDDDSGSGEGSSRCEMLGRISLKWRWVDKFGSAGSWWNAVDVEDR